MSSPSGREKAALSISIGCTRTQIEEKCDEEGAPTSRCSEDSPAEIGEEKPTARSEGVTFSAHWGFSSCSRGVRADRSASRLTSRGTVFLKQVALATRRNRHMSSSVDFTARTPT